LAVQIFYPKWRQLAYLFLPQTVSTSFPFSTPKRYQLPSPFYYFLPLIYKGKASVKSKKPEDTSPGFCKLYMVLTKLYQNSMQTYTTFTSLIQTVLSVPESHRIMLNAHGLKGFTLTPSVENFTHPRRIININLF
jgi:hypothetical protein